MYLPSPGRQTHHTFRICRRVNHQDFLNYAGQNAYPYRHRKKRNGRPADAGNRQKGAFTTWGKIRRDIVFTAKETTRIQV